MSLKKFFNSLISGVNARNEKGETRLYRAVREGNLQEVKKLLKKKADPNIPNAHGITPLHLAAYWGEAAITEALLKSGANVDANTGKGWTPLHSAAIAGGLKTRKSIIDMLRRAGSRDDIRDKHGMTANDYLILWQHDAVAAARLRETLKSQIKPANDGVCAKCGQIHKYCGPTSPKHV